MSDTTWRALITKAMGEDDNWGQLEAHEPTDPSWLDTSFNDGYGGSEGLAFTLWTKHYVYFPMTSEWAGRAPRNPDGTALGHQGGW